MTNAILALAAAGLVAASGASAETRSRIHSSGDWAVYRVSDAEVTLDGRTRRLPEVCLAETALEGGVVRIYLPPPSMGASVRGKTIGVIAANAWQFRSHTAALDLGPPDMTLSVEGAYYSGNMVSFSMTGDQSISYVLQIMAETFTGPFDVVNERGQRLASFSSRGMAAAIAALNACGGLPPE